MKTVEHKFKDGSVLKLEKVSRMSFPAGTKVLVTDPCYWFDNKEEGILANLSEDVWSAFCNLMDDYSLPSNQSFGSYGKAIFTTKEGRKIEFLYTSTAHGDGSYRVACNHRLSQVSGDGYIGVDAGMFGIVLLDDAKAIHPKGFKGDKFGCGVVFETKQEITVDVDGEDMEGDISCVTGYDEEEDDF